MRVDHENNPIRHRESTLNLSREVGVARGVDDVDLISCIVLGILYGRGLGGNSDATLTLEIARIQNSGLAHFCLVLAKDVRLLEQAVYKGSFAVVDVSDNGDITDMGGVVFHE